MAIDIGTSAPVTPTQEQWNDAAAGIAHAIRQGSALDPAGPAVPVKVPRGFGADIPFKIYRRYGKVQTDFDIELFRPQTAVEYYVNPSTGNNANAGTSRALPLKTLRSALAKAGERRIIITGLTRDTIQLKNESWSAESGYPTARNFSVEVEGPYRYISCWSAGTVLPTFTQHAGPIFKVNTGTDKRFIDHNPDLRDALGICHRPPMVASLAAVEEPGTQYHDGVNTLYVHALDSRNLVGDIWMIHVEALGANGGIPDADMTACVSGVDFTGGATWRNQSAATAIRDRTLLADAASFQGGGGAGGTDWNGGAGLGVFNKCLVANQDFDGFNHHGSTSLGVSPDIFEIDCVGRDCGLTSGSNQMSTAHEAVRVCTINADYQGARDTTIQDIHDAKRLVIAGRLGRPKNPVGKNIGLSNNAQAWLDGLALDDNPNSQYSGGASTVELNFTNMPAPTQAAGSLGAFREY